MLNENKYKSAIYLFVIFIGLILTFFGYLLPGGIGQSILVNIASNLITTGVFSFFIIERLIQSQENKNKSLLLLQEEQNKQLFLEQENKNRERSLQEINVVLVSKESQERFKLPIELRRGEFTRSEIQGRIGMLPMKEAGSRYSINDLGGQHFLRKINEILESENSKDLEILCDQNEIEQFSHYEDYRI